MFDEVFFCITFFFRLSILKMYNRKFNTLEESENNGKSYGICPKAVM